MPTPTKY